MAEAGALAGVQNRRQFDASRFVEPGLGLALDATFALSKRDRIFVLGNCFGQQFEYKLADAGYRADGAKLGPVYSISVVLQTVRWALHGGFGPDHVIELEPGVWFNPHRAPYSPYPTRDAAVAEHAATLAAVGEGLRCADVLVVVLGVVEYFVDTVSGSAMNCLPVEADVLQLCGRALPLRDRHADVLAGALALANEVRAARPDLRMLWGVSPITQDSTLFGPDVLVSNAYCKSTLRSALGEAVERLRESGVPADYFPCYELGTLNPRERVFKEEFLGKAYGRMVRGRFVRDVVIPTLLGAYAAE